MKHLKKAKDLIASGNDDDLRYAALEMRYCIEHIFYGYVPQYKAELPDDVIEGTVWRPADIIDMIADIDPTVVHDSVISMGAQPALGVPPTRMVVIGRQTGLSKDLARKVYHKLGFYLHARTDRKRHDAAHLRKRLLRLLPYLDKYENDTIIFAGGERYHFNCEACGRPVAKRSEHLERDPYVKCPNRRCGAIYEYHADGRHKMLQQKVVCEVCGTDNWCDLHLQIWRAESGAPAYCVECKAEYKVFKYLQVQRSQPASSEVKSANESSSA